MLSKMESVHGNINHAMSENYSQFGVDDYYRKVATTYRNPFFPGIKKVVFALLNRWWEAEGHLLHDGGVGQGLRVLDMAAGSGEATLCLLEWEAAARGTQRTQGPSDVSTALSSISSTSSTRSPFIPPNARRPAPSAKSAIGAVLPSISSDVPAISVSATDPYTSPAYAARTSRQCHPLSFSDLASGLVAPDLPPADASGFVWDMIICSFALHLVPESEMFPLCYELSNKAKWLVVIAPHKKPEIKDGWGWTRWNLTSWTPAGESIYGNPGEGDSTETALEIVREKVKLRLYRSMNA